jgi:ABC-type branched-subunit amino acid transport system ATPase component
VVLVAVAQAVKAIPIMLLLDLPTQAVAEVAVAAIRQRSKTARLAALASSS